MHRKYKIYDIDRKAEWEELFATAHFTHMTQSWNFGEAKRASKWRPRRIVIKQDGQPVAICQVLYKMIAGIPVAARINQGPVMLTGHAEKDVDVLIAIRNHWRYLLHGLLLIAPAATYSDKSLEALKAMGFRLRNHNRWTSSRVDLMQSEEEMRKKLNSKWRNQLNKSEHQGLQFVVCDSPFYIEWILQRHIDNMKEKDFDGPSSELLLALYKESPADFNIFKVVREGNAVASVVAYKFGDIAHYYIGNYSSEGRRLNAGNFILWNTALELKRLGCTHFDLGGHSNNSSSGFSGFKLGMNGQKYELVGEFWSL